MANYVVFAKSSGGSTEPPANTVAPNILLYWGDFANEDAACDAAALKMELGPNVYMWATPLSNLTRYVTSIGASVG